MTSLGDVSIIIPTRDRPAPLERLLQSIAKWAPGSQVVVVDDGSVRPVADLPPAVTLVRHERPRWVSAARNSGAEAACGKFLFFIDDDAVLMNDAVRVMCDALDRTKNAGIVGPTIVHLNDPARVWCNGARRHPVSGRTTMRAAPGKRAATLPIEAFPTAFAIPRAVFDLVGGFDELRFPMGMEEADLAFRVVRAGYQIRLAEGAIVGHDFPTNEPARWYHIDSPARAYLTARGRTLFLRLYAPRGWRGATQMGMWLCALLPAHVAAALRSSSTSFSTRIELVRSLCAGAASGLRGAPWRE